MFHNCFDESGSRMFHSLYKYPTLFIIWYIIEINTSSDSSPEDTFYINFKIILDINEFERIVTDQYCYSNWPTRFQCFSGYQWFHLIFYWQDAIIQNDQRDLTKSHYNLGINTYTCTISRDPHYWHRLSWNRAWIINHNYVKLWDGKLIYFQTWKAVLN